MSTVEELEGASQVMQLGKESACRYMRHKRCEFSLWVGKIPWRRKWQPIPVFLPGEFQGQRSLAGYSSRGHRVRHNLPTKHRHPRILFSYEKD